MLEFLPMTPLPLVYYPDPLLKQVAQDVARFDGGLHKLLDQMRETMYMANGVGLAAPQVGVSDRVTVIDISKDGSEVLELMNPVITGTHGEIEMEEGCLSIPEYREVVTRANQVEVSAQDRHGKPFTFEAQGLLAVCVQHEIDHLNGILFFERLSFLKRNMFARWYKKHGPFVSGE